MDTEGQAMGVGRTPTMKDNNDQRVRVPGGC